MQRVFRSVPCARCGQRFVPELAYGRWACRMHPSEQYDATRMTWACCGARIGGGGDARDRRGCWCLDHTLGNNEPDEGLLLLAAHTLVEQPPPASLVDRRDFRLCDFPGVWQNTASVPADKDWAPQARAAVEAAYRDPVFQRSVAPGGGAWDLLVKRARARPSATALVLDDTNVHDLVVHYWRATPSAQPPVTLLLVRPRAPFQDADTLERVKRLDTFLAS